MRILFLINVDKLNETRGVSISQRFDLIKQDNFYVFFSEMELILV